MRRIFFAALLLFACGESAVLPVAHDGGVALGDGGAPDAGDSAPRDAGAPDAQTTQAACEETSDRVACAYATREYRVGVTTLTDRRVHYATPPNPAPAEGYPVVLFFQGSFFSAERSFEADRSTPLGGLHLARTFARLLDAGYAVLAPEAHVGGSTFWDTNVPPFSIAWETSSDHRLMIAILQGIEDGDFGALDPTRLYATGISSGGYMTSRMAESYPGRFTALAIHSASYATCSGALCVLPRSLPDDHPPTLFVHGADDLVVPIGTMARYEEALRDDGVATRIVRVEDGGHEWLEAAVDAIPAWFDAFP